MVDSGTLELGARDLWRNASMVHGNTAAPRLGLLSQVPFITYGVLTSQYGFCASSVIFLGVYARGYYKVMRYRRKSD